MYRVGMVALALAAFPARATVWATTQDQPPAEMLSQDVTASHRFVLYKQVRQSARGIQPDELIPIPDEPIEPIDVMSFENRFGDVVLHLTARALDGDAGEQGPSTVLAVYGIHGTPPVPDTIWSGDVAWSAERATAYVVLVRSKAWDISMSVYAVDPAARVAGFPLQLDPEDTSAWPQPQRPLGTLRLTLNRPEYGGDINEGGYVSGISRIRVIPQRESLFLLAERDQPGAPTLYFRFHLATQAWTHVTLTDEPIEPQTTPF